MQDLISRTKLRRFILAKVAALTPSNPITRVSADAMDRYEAILRNMIIQDVKRHPTRGKTFTEVWDR